MNLWAGVGGILLAMASLGCRCVDLSAESDPKIAQGLSAIFPQAVSASMLDEAIARRDVKAVLVAGGCPSLAAQRTETATLLHKFVR